MNKYWLLGVPLQGDKLLFGTLILEGDDRDLQIFLDKNQGKVIRTIAKDYALELNNLEVPIYRLSFVELSSED